MYGEKTAAIILAGVHDWGACALNRACLRPLAPVANLPLIEHVLSAVATVGVNAVAVCSNGDGPTIREAIGDRPLPGAAVTYLDDVMPRGPAGCMKDAAESLDADHFIIAEGSVMPRFDLRGLLESHVRIRAALTVAVQRVGAAEDSAREPVGIYVLSPRTLEFIGTRGFQDIKEGLIPKLHAAGYRVDTYTIDGVAPRLAGLSSYFALNEWAVGRAIDGEFDLAGYEPRGTTLVHRDAQVASSARLLGPVMIGPGCRVGEDAVVVGPTAIGDDCIVEAGAVVSRSVLWSGCVVQGGARLDRCLIARGARVDAGTRHSRTVHLASDPAASPPRPNPHVRPPAGSWTRRFRRRAEAERAGL